MGQRYEVPNSFFLQNLRLGHKLTGEQEKRSPSSYNAYPRGPGLRWHEICSYCSWISLLSGRNGHYSILFSHAIPLKSMRSRQYFHPVSVVQDQQVVKKTSALVVYLLLVYAACPQQSWTTLTVGSRIPCSLNPLLVFAIEYIRRKVENYVK